MKDIILENDLFRLTVGEDAIVKSLIHKKSGIECIQKDVHFPLATVTQDRLYNNELKLAYPTQETVFPATGILINIIFIFEECVDCGTFLFNCQKHLDLTFSGT